MHCRCSAGVASACIAGADPERVVLASVAGRFAKHVAQSGHEPLDAHLHTDAYSHVTRHMIQLYIDTHMHAHSVIQQSYIFLSERLCNMLSNLSINACLCLSCYVLDGVVQMARLGGSNQRLRGFEGRVGARSVLAEVLLEQWSWGTLSAVPVQTIAAAALQDGTNRNKLRYYLR